MIDLRPLLAESEKMSRLGSTRRHREFKPSGEAGFQDKTCFLESSETALSEMLYVSCGDASGWLSGNVAGIRRSSSLASRISPSE
jgi:hypothetical protein